MNFAQKKKIVNLQRDDKLGISLYSTWSLDFKVEENAVGCWRVNQDELEFPSMNRKIFWQHVSDFPVMWSVFSESIISTTGR